MIAPEILRTPTQWADIVGCEILDADGWHDKDFEEPIGYEEFERRLVDCTLRMGKRFWSRQG